MGHDMIRLTGLRLSGRHGVFDFEKEDPQPFTVDAELELDLRGPGRSDDLNDTISYAHIADLIQEVVTRETYDLIEALAETLARAILLHDKRIHAVAVTVHKPQAPLTQTFDDVSVTIRRSRAHVKDLPALDEPRRQVSGVYEGELVDEAASAPSPVEEENEARLTTPTAQLGPYDRASLAELSPQAPAEHLRDPDLPAAFAVRCVLALGSNLGDSRAILASAVQALEAHESVVVVNVSPLASTAPVGGPANQRNYLNQVVEIETQLSPHDLLDVAQQIETDHNRVRRERWGPRTLDVDIVTYAGATIDSPRLQVPHPSAAERAFVLLPWSWMDPVALLNGRPVRELAREAPDFHEVRKLDDAAQEPEQ
ncbi:2-amino-4-hydroxy-6-hydroxymethyldihydropteridine diphosphokinase [Nesterenkonia sp.]|uniref:2-amino-4-hydroxy-6- hydroxymethyldihydropteridine diphosphokinase n=1 Tax=Nesterenkonia sp. TaxID=704201 RepID=UPI0026243A6E|nr:2-amino-4-hydroxy-6-hydroxymethyldihydropteridine diphosphokinase [Nesterenkonia sp.]